MPVSVDYSGLLFQMTIFDAYFRCLFQMTFPDDFSRWLSDASELLFQITVPDEYFGCFFQMTFPDDCSFARLIRVLAVSPYFHGRFLFQPIIRLIGPTTDSFLSDGFLLQNYGPPDKEKIFFGNFAKFTGNHLCQGLFLSGPKTCNFILFYDYYAKSIYKRSFYE